MRIDITLKQDNGEYDAEGIYCGNRTIVKIGSVINMNAASYAKGKLIRHYRDDRGIVSEKGIVLAESVFPSISAVARFVTGRSVNGFYAWRIKGSKKQLGEYLEDKGLRESRKRK